MAGFDADGLCLHRSNLDSVNTEPKGTYGPLRMKILTAHTSLCIQKGCGIMWAMRYLIISGDCSEVHAVPHDRCIH